MSYIDEAAVQRCRDAGFTDPFFIGTKGYPNWQDFTDERIAHTRKFVEDTKAIFEPREPIAQIGTPDLADLRRKYLGESACDAAGLDDEFFSGVRWRAEADSTFREELKASMDAYWDSGSESVVINGKVHVYDKDGKLVTIQG